MRNDLSTKIKGKAKRKVRARQERSSGIWSWLGMWGMVGWSVALPSVVGVIFGSYIDRIWEGTIIWSITLLFVGLVLGCLNAWFWIRREGR